ncbi:MAG: hypothetical protein LKI80_09550 [Sporolactobacillus sp.]|nr:hypothetical protein [Sporolactobacillus sp.]
MRSKRILMVLLAFSCCAAVFLFAEGPLSLHEKPAVTYFPESSAIIYHQRQTQLDLDPQTGQMSWRVQSDVNRPVFLLQNFSLLYRNNRLIAVINDWRSQAASLAETKGLTSRPGFYQALSVHHAEEHHDDQPFGKEAVSGDRLFIGQNQEGWFAFRKPKTDEEARWKGQSLAHIASERSQIIKQARTRFAVDPSHYRLIPLSELSDATIPIVFPFGEANARRIVAQLWEGIYKTVVRGIQITPDERRSAIGSSMPILLIGQDHLLVIIRAGDGHLSLLKQIY